MTARIFKPAKNAMQSGRAKTREWQLDYEPEQPRAVEPLMGWTSSGDMKQQLTLHFDTREDAVAYCERKGIAYQVIEPKDSVHRQIAYADNFAFKRVEPVSTSGPTSGAIIKSACATSSESGTHAKPIAYALTSFAYCNAPIT